MVERADRERVSCEGVYAEHQEADKYMLSRSPRYDSWNSDADDATRKTIDGRPVDSVDEICAEHGCPETEEINGSCGDEVVAIIKQYSKESQSEFNPTGQQL